MHDKPNAAVIERWYKAFLANDKKTLEELVSSDFEWHFGGDSPISTTYCGVDGITSLRSALADHSRGTFQAWKNDSWDVAVSDVHSVVLDRWIAEKENKKLDAHISLVVVAEQEKICLAFTYFTNQAAFEKFWK